MNKLFLEDQIKITKVKSIFTKYLSKELNLIEVQAPLLAKKGDGIQDDLSGHENAVQVNVSALNETFEVVHSLAKWKRYVLSKYEFKEESGLYTHMKALRPDEEELSQKHSIFVDQWDWEKVIKLSDRKIIKLKEEVLKIFKALQKTEEKLFKKYGIEKKLAKEIKCIHSEELRELYPNKTSKERENLITKKYGAVFLMGIGGKLKDGTIHDVRAPDYDDWISKNCDGFLGLNGDILLWNEKLNESFEISSMGIRVSAESLKKQLKEKDEEYKLSYDWHKELLEGKFLQTIGGGIGQSRLTMYFLNKSHIGQVQVGVWDQETKEKYNTLF